MALKDGLNGRASWQIEPRAMENHGVAPWRTQGAELGPIKEHSLVYNEATFSQGNFRITVG